MNVRKLVLPVVVMTMVATVPADAAQRRGGGGGGARAGGGGGGGGATRAVRSGPSQGRAVPRAAAPVRGPYGGGAGYRSGGYYRPAYRSGGYYRPGYNQNYYRSGYYRSGYYRPYYGYRPYYYRPYYSFYPRFSVGFGIWAGFPIGYASFYYGSPYPYGYPYPYPYSYPGAYGYGYPTASASPYPYPNSAPGYASSTPGYPQSGVTASATGGITFEITPGTAEVYIDGNFVGVVDDFSPTARPLTLSPGRHRIEVRAPGYETIVLDSDVPAAQVVPYRGTMRLLREP
jgi:PEGA domain